MGSLALRACSNRLQTVGEGIMMAGVVSPSRPQLHSKGGSPGIESQARVSVWIEFVPAALPLFPPLPNFHLQTSPRRIRAVVGKNVMSTKTQPLTGQAPAASLSNEEILRYSRHLIMPEVGMDGQLK